MLTKISDACSRVVSALEQVWSALGWILWLSILAAPFLLPQTSTTLYIVVACLALLGIWWVIDVLDQQIEWWQILLGVVMLAFAVLSFYFPLGRLVLWVATWSIYWTRIRE